MAAVALCPAPPTLVLPGGPQASSASVINERFYKFGTPSPPSQQGSPAAVYSDLEDSGFHSDEEIQKVIRGQCFYSLIIFMT